MESQDLDPQSISRAADVAADYEGLQGLTGALQGAALVVMAISGSILWGSVLMCFSVLIGQGYYHERYGQASMRGRHLGRQLLVGLPCVGLVAAAFVADHFLAGPIAFGPLAGAVALIGITRVTLRHVGLTRVHWVVIGALALSSLMPLVASPAPTALWRYSVFVVGLALLAIGTIDHLRLARSLNAQLRSTGGEADA